MKILNTVLLITMVILLLLPAVASAQPNVCAFCGSVSINGNTVPDGTLVTASIDGVKVVTSYTFDSMYSIKVAGSYTGKTVVFAVNSDEAATSLWEAGGAKSLNLSLTSGPVSIAQGLNSIAGKYDRIWTYDNMTQQWQFYGTNGPCPNDFLDLINGQGYWIHTTQSCTLTYGGYVYNLDYGWNLVGWLG